MKKNLDELLSQLISLHPKYIDLSLNRLFKLLKKIDNPHLNLPPIIHIAGTNGKGSTLSYIRNILIENNLNVHAYISPHLNSFNERIILSNKEIKTRKLYKTLEFIKKINSNNPITFFEITTAAAFYLFAKEKADFLILETGLGGRLDATNVIVESLIDIITPIGIDHQEFLGKNIFKITDEKLGIIKKNSTIIISKQKNNVFNYIKNKLKNKKNKKIFHKKDFKISINEKNKFEIIFEKKIQSYSKPKLLGDHQIENATTAIITILQLNKMGYSFSKKTINNGIIKTKWPGRLEYGKISNIKVYLDGAHNIDGAIEIFKFFRNKKLKVWLVIGMLNNKNIYGFLKVIKPILNGLIAIPIPFEKNSLKQDKILEASNKLKIRSLSCKSINEANSYLVNKIKPKTILISGSLYLIGRVRNKFL